MSYSELCSKSCFSFLLGASHPEELVSEARRLGYHSIGLCDRSGFYGMVRAYKKAEELQIPLILGTEIEVEGAALILLVRNLTGYRQICRLLSESFQYHPEAKKFSERPVPRALLEKYLPSQDIHLLLAPRAFPSQELFSFLRERQMPHQLVTQSLSPEQDWPMKQWIKNLDRDIPRIWTWDPHFHQASRHELFEVLQGIRENIPLSQKRPSFNAEKYLKPIKALSQFKVPRSWIQRGIEMAESCQFSPKQIRYHYPQEWLPEGLSAYEFLEILCKKGCHIRYPQGVPTKVYTQLQHELSLVKELSYEDYFLTVWDIVQFARSQKILCQGRGSAANSIICYLLEITSIDPIQMNLLFERFISKERNEAPDIDIDFEHERREEVIQYVYTKYGRHRAGMVATLITYRTRSAIRDVGRILEADPKIIDALSTRAQWRENIWKDESSDPKIQRTLRLAKQLKGFPRHLGQHTGGMIICQDRLDEISPIENASMPGRSVVQWDKYDIEKLGLLKIDLLSLGMLTCLRKSFDLLKQATGQELELHQIPHDDAKTYEMIQRSQTIGVFQIESRAQMSMLPRLKPKTFYDLVIEVAIVRPGPIQGGMVHPYLRRRMGLEPVEYAHPRLKPILEKTLGIPIFQEQVMKIAIEVAGYTPGEADALRRAMGAWKKSGDLQAFGDDICKRLIAQSVPPEFARRICDQILGFGEYGFPESHAASFALLTYASSYLKAHYPAVFLCALLNSLPMGFYSIHVLTSSFQREGVKILPLSLEKSEWDHHIEKQEDNGLAIRLGFRIVKGLSKKHVSEFIQKRQSQSKMDFYMFSVDERANLALAQENEKRRQAYWGALIPKPDALTLNKQTDVLFKKPDDLTSLLLDFEFMETSLQKHPSLLLKEKYWAYPISKERIHLSKDLESLKPNQNVLVYGITQVVQSPPTAKGMFFVTLEDETGFLNLVFTPQVFSKFKRDLQNDWALLVSGKLQKMQNYSSILVTQIIKRKAPKPIAWQRNKQKPWEATPLPVRMFH